MGTSTESTRTTAGTGEGLVQATALFTPPKPVAELVSKRLAVVMKLGQLEEARRRLQRGESLADAALTELSRQTREMKRLPGEAKLAAARKRLDKRLGELAASTESEDEGAGKHAGKGDGQDGRDVPPGLLEALRIGVRQNDLLVQRDSLTADLLAQAAMCLTDEPLTRVLDAQPEADTQVVGWTVYGASLEMFEDSTSKRLTALNAEQKAGEAGCRLEQLLAAIRRERQALAPVMVTAFWEAYEQAALALTGGGLDEADEPYVRAFLRIGLVGVKPWLIDAEVARTVLEQCAHPVRQRDTHPGASSVFYADEYLDLLARGEVTPSFDQDLELNEKGSDRWKVDKRWRQTVWGRTVEPLLTHACDGLRQRVEAANGEIAGLEEQLAGLDRGDKDYKAKRAELQDSVQERKVAIARAEHAVEIIEKKHLVEQKALADEAAAKLEKMDVDVDMSDLVRREVKAVRHVCKLTARLKETFVPLQLRDRLRFDGMRVNDRETLQREVADVEKRDPDVFRHIQIPAKKRGNRTYVRYAPYMVIVPSFGLMAYAWNPRGGTEVGRLGFPLLNQRPGDLPQLLCHVLADFRFDTSKQDAGVDLLTSDTLVAAYATARWDWRKKPRDQREKAGIYNEENDRTNWRRHYELFITSSLEGGKKLFFKNSEVYAAVLKYMGLPDGVEPMG